MKKKCRECHQVKTIKEFYKNARMLDGYFNHCKQCMNKRAKAWRENNPTMTKKYNAQEKAYRNFGLMCHHIIASGEPMSALITVYHEMFGGDKT